MTRLASGVVVAVVVTGLTGCATRSFVDREVREAERRSTAKITEVQTQVAETTADISALQANDSRIEAEMSKLSATVKEALERATAAHKLATGKFVYEVTLTDDQVRFGFNQATLSDDGKAALDAFAQRLKTENRNVFVEVQGHTDSIGSDLFNLQLGFRRAEVVRRYLVENAVVPGHRVDVASYGESRPVADNGTAEGRSRNRRVTLVVLE